MPDPIYGSDDDFAEGNASDPISGLHETPVDEFQHPTVVATASKLGHTKGGGNVTIDTDGTMWAPEPVDPSWNNITGKPSTFPPSTHGHSEYQATSEKNVAGGYPGIDAITQKISPQWLPDTAEAKKIVVQNSWSLGAAGDSFNGWAYKPAVSFMYIGANNTYLIKIDNNLNIVAGYAMLSTAGSWLGIYIPSIDKYHVITKSGTTIHVVNPLTFALETPITIGAYGATRYNFDYTGNYEYYMDNNGVCQRNLVTGIINRIVLANTYGFKSFTQDNVNYIAVVSAGSIYIYNESLVLVSNRIDSSLITSTSLRFDYLNNKLAIAQPALAGRNILFVNTSDISSISLTSLPIAARGIRLFDNYFAVETAPQYLNGVTNYDVNLAIYDYNGEILDNKSMFGYNNYCVQSIQYDSATNMFIVPTSSLSQTWNSAFYFLKYK